MRGNALTGAGYLVRGASLLTRPTLRLFVLVPLAVNILIFSAVIWWGVSFLAGWLDSIMAGIPDWLGFLEWLLWPLVGLLVTLTTDTGKILAKLHQVSPVSEMKFIPGIKIAHLCLKHRQGKNHKTRIVAFVG